MLNWSCQKKLPRLENKPECVLTGRLKGEKKEHGSNLKLKIVHEMLIPL